MEINSSYLYCAYMHIAYAAKQPSDIFHVHQIEGVSQSFLRDTFLKTLVLFDDDEILDNLSHPQHKMVLRIKQFLDDNDNNQDPTYYFTSFISFATGMISWCMDDQIFTFIKLNQRADYAWFEISEDGMDIKLKQNTFRDEDVPLRVKLNKVETFSFNLCDGLRLKTPRGDFLEIDGRDATITKATGAFDCVIILTKGNDIKRVYYNDKNRAKVWRCAYLKVS